MDKTKTTWTVLAISGILWGMTGMAEARDQIRVVGSSTVFPFSSVVAEQFGKSGKFKTPIVESTGSGGGIKLFCASAGEDAPDITNSSRKIKKEEIEICQKNGVKNVAEVTIGYDGIVLAHAKTAKPFDLTLEQVWRALAKDTPVNGKMAPNPYKKWSDIDPSLPADPIHVYGPPPTSGTRDAFVELVMDKGCEKAPEIKAMSADDKKKACGTLREDGGYVEAGENDNLIVQKLVADPSALGIFGYSFLEENEDKVQAAHLEGKEPTYENISALSYPAARLLYFYVKLDNIGKIPGIAEYVDEFMNDKASGEDGYLTDKGFIPLSADLRVKAKETANKPIF